MTANRYRVPIKQWRKWSPGAQEMFNLLHAEMVDQEVYKHPKALAWSKEQWKTTRWNAAWIAADFYDRLIYA